jgi:phosphatidate cytidylyltransferase
MNLITDHETFLLLGGVLGLLTLATALGAILRARVRSEAATPTIQNLNARIKAWWVMIGLFAVAMATGGIGSILLFALTSFLALREFITLTPTKPADHRTLFWVFFVNWNVLSCSIYL